MRLFLVLLGSAVAIQIGVSNTQQSLRGIVLDEHSQPVPGAWVFLAAQGPPSARMTLTDADGSYSISNLPIGVDFELRAEHHGRSSAVTLFRVSEPGERVSIELRIEPRIRFTAAPHSGLNATLRNDASGNYHMPELMLGGIATLDYDGDGCADIFLPNGADLQSLIKTEPEFHNRLYRGGCDMTFTDVTDRAGVAGEGYSMGAAAADYDNDADVDLFVAGLNRNLLYRNRGDGTFEDVTLRAGLSGVHPERGKMWAVAAGWFDYDRDGRLDLFVVNYVDWSRELETPCRAGDRKYYCHPKVFSGLPNQLFQNTGDGTFKDVSAHSKIADAIGKGMGVAFGDVDDNGFSDVFVTNDSVPNSLFLNQGDGTFRERALEAGVAYAFHGRAVAGMGADVRDYDDDGRPDIVLSAMYFDEFPLYRNVGPPRFFTDETVSSGLALASRSLTGWSIGFYDLDNDRHKDLFVATSHFPGTGRLNTVLGADAAQPNHVFRNSGNGKFVDVSASAGADFQISALHHGSAFADFDNDGRIDVVVTALNSTPKLFRNTSPGPAHWLAVRLVGKRSNRDGIGARIRLTLPNGGRLYNQATTSVGYASSSEPLVRFGLGPYPAAKEVQIRWPSGQLQTLPVQRADQLITVREP
jgi:enediyne biosynthesis protein E4